MSHLLGPVARLALEGISMVKEEALAVLFDRLASHLSVLPDNGAAERSLGNHVNPISSCKQVGVLLQCITQPAADSVARERAELERSLLLRNAGAAAIRAEISARAAAIRTATELVDSMFGGLEMRIGAAAVVDRHEVDESLCVAARDALTEASDGSRHLRHSAGNGAQSVGSGRADSEAESAEDDTAWAAFWARVCSDTLRQVRVVQLPSVAGRWICTSPGPASTGRVNGRKDAGLRRVLRAWRVERPGGWQVPQGTLRCPPAHRKAQCVNDSHPDAYPHFERHSCAKCKIGSRI